MALIKCPECGKEISNKATACVHCGYPIPSMPQEMSTRPQLSVNEPKEKICNWIPKEIRNNKKRAIAITSIIMALLIAFCIGGTLFNNNEITIKNLMSLDTRREVSSLLGKEPTAKFNSYLVEFLDEDFYVQILYKAGEANQDDVHSIFLQYYYPGTEVFETIDDYANYTITKNDRIDGNECVDKVVDAFTQKYGKPEISNLKKDVLCYSWKVGERSIFVYDYANSKETDASWGAVKIYIGED
jgi:RNase P/RNase MRP subunit POP5